MFTKHGFLHLFFITKLFQKIQENMESSSKNMISSYLIVSELENVQHFRHYRPTMDKVNAALDARPWYEKPGTPTNSLEGCFCCLPGKIEGAGVSWSIGNIGAKQGNMDITRARFFELLSGTELIECPCWQAVWSSGERVRWASTDANCLALSRRACWRVGRALIVTDIQSNPIRPDRSPQTQIAGS